MTTKTTNLRLDSETEADLKALSALMPNLSLNQVINNAIRAHAQLMTGSNEERSWRRGEAVGLAAASDWCRQRADFFARDRPHDAKVAAQVEELRWAAKQFATLAREARKAADRLPPGIVTR